MHAQHSKTNQTELLAKAVFQTSLSLFYMRQSIKNKKVMSLVTVVELSLYNSGLVAAAQELKALVGQFKL
ncbi:hypothetical protein ACQKP8_23515 [Photobacterium alginatilyticum]|uniref:hypothetical protein n=1 Tax=Photobacterium alginatilyticum TaxID=1775171 RepID=UPI004068254C